MEPEKLSVGLLILVTLTAYIPVSWMAHNNLGILLKKQGKPQEAVEHYSEVLRIKPDHVQARDNLHLALQKTGKTNKAATTGARPWSRSPVRS